MALSCEVWNEHQQTHGVPPHSRSTPPSGYMWMDLLCVRPNQASTHRRLVCTFSSCSLSRCEHWSTQTAWAAARIDQIAFTRSAAMLPYQTQRFVLIIPTIDSNYPDIPLAEPGFETLHSGWTGFVKRNALDSVHAETLSNTRLFYSEWKCSIFSSIDSFQWPEKM